jgi:hypothetical protein
MILYPLRDIFAIGVKVLSPGVEAPSEDSR